MRVVVGRIGKPHGVRGEVSIQVWTDEPAERFAAGSTVLVQGSARVLSIDHAHWHGSRLLLGFVGVGDRDAAEALRGTVLEVDRPDDQVPADPEEFYDSALVGCQVVGVDGAPIGEVTEVVHLPGQDVLSVRSGVDGREVLVPFVQAIVPTVDLAARRVVIDPPSGLLDAND